MTGKEAALKLENVWKTYRLGGEVINALRGASLEVKKGEFFALQGASGSGKSTAMHIMGALDVPDKGTVCIRGKDVSRLSGDSLAGLRGRTIGFVFQQFNLIPTLTAIENVMLPMVFQGVPEADRLERASELLREVELTERKGHHPNQLSGGQQQRVAIARALANDPEIILADEPTGNLDSITGQKVFGLLKGLHEKGKTVVIVTHNEKLVAEAQTIAYIKDGAIVRVKKS
ncbi:ABC transporter ATP-binding protein [Candidatus Woesearchaeota archaeon]|nr:ABC transporter ATP-binding protein [Candidatus Woesearchaeota archaeon]